MVPGSVTLAMDPLVLVGVGGHMKFCRVPQRFDWVGI